MNADIQNTEQHNAGLNFRSCRNMTSSRRRRRRSVDLVSTGWHVCVVFPVRRKFLENYSVNANIAWYWRRWVGLDRRSKAIFWSTNLNNYLVTALYKRTFSVSPVTMATAVNPCWLIVMDKVLNAPSLPLVWSLRPCCGGQVIIFRRVQQKGDDVTVFYASLLNMIINGT